MVDIVALRSEIEDMGVAKTVIAKKCGIARQTLEKRLTNPETLTVNDAYGICQALRITDSDKICEIFFAKNV